MFVCLFLFSDFQDIIQQLHEGTDFTKIIEKSSKKHSRKFTLSKDYLYVTYHPSKKPPAKARSKYKHGMCGLVEGNLQDRLIIQRL